MVLCIQRIERALRTSGEVRHGAKLAQEGEARGRLRPVLLRLEKQAANGAARSRKADAAFAQREDNASKRRGRAPERSVDTTESPIREDQLR